MKKMFRLQMLPARKGDALWIQYGDQQNPSNILIDGGNTGTGPRIVEQIEQLPAGKRHIELLVVSHVDGDHIEGILELLANPDLDVTFGDIWFNGWRHFKDCDLEDFGPAQGEQLTAKLIEMKAPWNAHLKKKAIVIPDEGDLPIVELDGGMKLTLLSPTKQKLAELKPKWEAECKKAHLIPGEDETKKEVKPEGYESMGVIDIEELAEAPFKEDVSEANGASIAFVAEFDNRRVLFSGDAHPSVLLDGINRMVPQEGKRLRLNCVKMPHHGSKGNIMRELIEKLECPRYLFSTNGVQFKHPDKESVARVLMYGGGNADFVFNYKTKCNEVWDEEGWMEEYQYTVQYPGDGEDGIAVDI